MTVIINHIFYHCKPPGSPQPPRAAATAPSPDDVTQNGKTNTTLEVPESSKDLKFEPLKTTKNSKTHMGAEI